MVESLLLRDIPTSWILSFANTESTKLLITNKVCESYHLQMNMFTFYSSVLRHLLRMVLEKISHWSWMNTVTYFPQDKEEFFLVSVTKHKQEFDTFICWVRIVKIVKNNQNTKMTRFTEFTRFKKFSWVSSDNHSLTNILLTTLSELVVW